MGVGSEQKLVQAALRGDAAAFAVLVAPARGRVMAVVARLVGADEAEDVVQEALLRAFLDLSRLRDSARFESWLCGVAINVAKMRLRSRASQARVMAAAATHLTAPVADERELLADVRDALELLPPGQRDVVLMHYIEDLSCDQIAQLLATSPGAVRVRLHRARRQLRRELAPLAPVPVVPQTKELAMVDVKVDDILVRLADDDPPHATEQMAMVVLKEKRGERTMPILIALVEGAALAMRLADEAFQRPLTSDLMVELLRAAGATIDRVAITSIRDNTFYALISINGEDVDARPSDAINLAVRVGAPIVVDERVLDEHALGEMTIEEKIKQRAAIAGLAMPPGTWQSLSVQLVRALQPTPWRASRG